MITRSNTDEFIKKAVVKHGDRYDYSLVDYVLSCEKVCVICQRHGKFFIRPNEHLMGGGCKRCANEKSNKKLNELCKREFVNKAIKSHGDKYDYSLVDYKKAVCKVKIICKEHGVFEQTPNAHLGGGGCRKCQANTLRLYFADSKSSFINKAQAVHGNRYNYDLVNYVNAHVKVQIICLQHGMFLQEPNAHVRGCCGCPQCHESHGERFIYNVFIDEAVPVLRQQRFDGCGGLKPYSFDFYVPAYNAIIEYHGEQHYRSVEMWGGESALRSNKIRDSIKKQWAVDNGYKFIEYNYRQSKDFIKSDILRLLNEG